MERARSAVAADDADGRGHGPARGPRTAREVRDAYERYGGDLYRYLFKALDDRVLAEEIVQETFVRAARTSRRSQVWKGSLRGGLFAIARDTMAGAASRRGSRGRADGQTVGDPFDRLLATIRLDEALRKLAPEHHMVLVETYYCGLRCADIAAAEGVPCATVRSRLYYAMRALRLVLEEHGWLM